MIIKIQINSLSSAKIKIVSPGIGASVGAGGAISPPAVVVVVVVVVVVEVAGSVVGAVVVST